MNKIQQIVADEEEYLSSSQRRSYTAQYNRGNDVRQPSESQHETRRRKLTLPRLHCVCFLVVALRPNGSSFSNRWVPPHPNISGECDHGSMLREHADEVSHNSLENLVYRAGFSTLCMSSSVRICSAQTRTHPRALSRPTRKVPSRHLVSVQRSVKEEGILGQLTTTTTSRHLTRNWQY
jgi:hypothetical protein